MAKSQKNKKSNSSSNSRSSSHSSPRSTSRSNSNSGNKRTKKQNKPRRKLQKHKRRVQKGGNALKEFKIIFKKFYIFTRHLNDQAESDAKYNNLQRLLENISGNIIQFLRTNREDELKNLNTNLIIINHIVENIIRAIDKQNQVIVRLRNRGVIGENGTFIKRRLYQQLINRVINIYFTEIRDLCDFYTELNNFSNLEYGNITEQEIKAQIEKFFNAKIKFENKFGTDSITQNTNNPNMGNVDFDLLKEKK